jgi:hypothetical protein
MAERRTGWAGVGFWLLVVGAVVALPVAILTTCQVNEYQHPPNAYHPASAALQGLLNIVVGAVIGALLAVPLTWMAVVIRRRKAGKRPLPPDAGRVPSLPDVGPRWSDRHGAGPRSDKLQPPRDKLTNEPTP